jgi:hypothetical protein
MYSPYAFLGLTTTASCAEIDARCEEMLSEQHNPSWRDTVENARTWATTAQQCPFKILGLTGLATLEDINYQQDLLLLEHKANPMATNVIRDACLRAIIAHDSIKCRLQRQAAESTEVEQMRQCTPESVRRRRASVLRIACQLLDHEYKKASNIYTNRFYLDQRAVHWDPDERREAERILHYGLKDSEAEVEETRLLQMQQEALKSSKHHSDVMHGLTHATTDKDQRIRELERLVQAKDARIQAQELQIRALQQKLCTEDDMETELSHTLDRAVDVGGRKKQRP